MANLPPEKLGSFYLGAIYENGKITDEVVNYDARDLTTHAVCVGMTGSGKTGLCIGLLEEAAIDKVPAIIVDPKGDMTNLLLQFENLAPEEFAPWINPDDASRKGMTLEDYTNATAETWKKGLAGWGQGVERIRLLKESVEYTVYTPGSDAGMPINILGSFAAPGIDFDSDAEMLRERIQGNVAALLGMINRKDDPSRSREGILLANLFEHHWRNEEDLDLTSLIMGIQNPPMNKLGVFDVDTFFPEKERFELSMEFNSLVASPQFGYWLKGDPLDIEKIYFTAEGKPRHSIFYIAHLSESERMFFVTLLLNSLIAWMRRQSGTTSLRSLLYFDEIFGYFPPTANPPSKKPLLTLLKQARAFGLGSILVTQNPVDIDYKGLANAGTWFIGKMQTERDKQRVLDGLKGAIAEAGSSLEMDFDELISALDSRVFLLHNVHEDEPVLMHTRWVMSYLRGPLTRPQVKKLMADRKSAPKKMMESASSRAASTTRDSAPSAVPPSLDPSIDQRFFVVWKSASEAGQTLGAPDSLKVIFKPQILAAGKVRFNDTKRSVDQIIDVSMLLPPPDDFGRVSWDESQSISQYQRKLVTEPDHPDSVPVSFLDVPETMNSAKEIKAVEKEFSDYLYNHSRHVIYEHEKLKIYQEGNESLESFQMRINHAAREMRDEEIDELQDRFEDKFERIQDRIRREEMKLDEQQAELKHRRTAEIIGVAETIFSVFKGRRRSISGAASKSRMRRKASLRMETLKGTIDDLHADFRDLEEELDEKIREVQKKYELLALDISKHEVKPRRTDVKVDLLSVVWHPYWINDRGDEVSAVG